MEHYRLPSATDKPSITPFKGSTEDSLIVQIELQFGDLAGPSHRVLLQTTRSMPLGYLFQYYAGYMGLPTNFQGLEFIFMDNAIQPQNTPETLMMEQGDVVRVVQQGQKRVLFADLIGTATPPQGLFRCNHRGCGLLFKEQSDELLRHMNVHYNTAGLFFCGDPSCPLVFALEVELDAHMAQHQIISPLMALAANRSPMDINTPTTAATSVQDEVPIRLNSILNRNTLDQPFHSPSKTIPLPHIHESLPIGILQPHPPNPQFVPYPLKQETKTPSPTKISVDEEPSVTAAATLLTRLPSSLPATPQRLPQASSPIEAEPLTAPASNDEIVLQFEKHFQTSINHRMLFRVKKDEILEVAFEKYVEHKANGIPLKRLAFVHDNKVVDSGKTANELGLRTGDVLSVYLRADRSFHSAISARRKKEVEKRKHEWEAFDFPFECSLCGTRFDKRISLARHKSSKHGEKVEDTVAGELEIETGKKKPSHKAKNKESVTETSPKKSDRPHTCNECGMNFKRAEHLKRHFQSKHSANKFYACPVQGCDRAFTRKDNRNQHLGKHIRANDGIQDMVDAGLTSFLSQFQNLKIPPRSKHLKDVPIKSDSVSPDPISPHIDSFMSDQSPDHNRLTPDVTRPETGKSSESESSPSRMRTRRSSLHTSPEGGSNSKRRNTQPDPTHKRRRTLSFSNVLDDQEAPHDDDDEDDHDVDLDSTMSQPHNLPRSERICAHCGITRSSQWRNGPGGTKLCNACGLYVERHGVMRHLNDVK